MRYVFGFLGVSALSLMSSLGCGDEGGTKTGHLVAPAVEGVAYETDTHQGLTDPEGGFRYEPGETVRFMVGKTLLGEVPARREVTPFDLTGAPIVTGTLRLCEALGTGHLGLLPRHPCAKNVYVPPARSSAAFSALVNLVVLLQSLDQDANPDNGIRITSEVRGLMTHAAIDLTQPWTYFAEDFQFRRVLGEAHQRGLFSRVHGATNPAPALQRLYEELDINPGIHGVVVALTDYNLIHEQHDLIERFAYDAAGNWTRREEDRNEDGVVDWYQTWEYDSDGNQTRWSLYEKPGFIWVYDELGYLVEEHSAEYAFTYERDPYGSVTREISEVLAAQRTTTQNWTYDEAGRSLGSVSDVNGVFERRTVYHYDEDGNLTLHESDYDDDGIADAVWIYEYNSQGLRTRTEWDYDADGVPDYIVIPEYDTIGNTTRTDLDEDGNGEPESIETFEYDNAGNLTRSTWTVDLDGDDVLETYTLEYRPDGRPEIDGIEYDADGDPLRVWDGTLTWLWTYDADGNPTREEAVTTNGHTEWVTTFEYEPTGFAYVVGLWPPPQF